MKNWFFLCVCLFLYIQAGAQTITVTDGKTGEPIPFVRVSSLDKTVNALTDIDGKVDLSPFEAVDSVQLSMIGFERLTLSTADLQNGALVDLQPAAFDLAPLEILDDVEIAEVVISATKWKEPRRDVPARISTISRREVELHNPQTAADLLGGGGEVYIQKSQQGGGSPMIRGFATNRLLITVDGVRMNTAIFRSGNVQNVISIDPFVVDRTEVFFGPGSVIYGSDAIGGVMSFNTLSPLLSKEAEPRVFGEAVARYSSANNERTGHFDVNVGFRKWALLTSFTHNNYGDLRMGRFGPNEYLRESYVQTINGQDVVVANDDPLMQRPSGFSQLNFMQKVLFKPSEQVKIEYALHHSSTSDYARYDRHIRTQNGLPRSADWRYGPQDWTMHLFTVDISQPTSFFDEITLQVAKQQFGESRLDRNFGDNILHKRVERVAAWSANLDLRKRYGRHEFYYGLESVLNDVGSVGLETDVLTGTTEAGPSRYPQSTWRSNALYLTYQYEASNRLVLRAGARGNLFGLKAAFDTTFYPLPFTETEFQKGAVTGSLGAIWRLYRGLSFNVNASTGFRSPNVDDMGKVFDSEPGAVVVPNPDLKAEYAYNIEAGIAKRFGKRLNVDVAAYYTLLQNALVRRDFTLNGQDSIFYDGELSQVQAIQNAAKARVYGIQAGFDLSLPGGFRLSSRFNWQKGEEELDDGSFRPLRSAAPAFGRMHLRHARKRYTLDLYAMYGAAVKYENLPPGEAQKDYLYAIDENGNPWSPGWHTLNFKATFDMDDTFSLSAGVENLFDLRYRPYSSGLVAPGRNFILALRAFF